MPIFEIERWPARIVREYSVYMGMELFGPKRDNVHAAMIAHILANQHSKQRVPFEDFMLRDPVEERLDRERRVVASFSRRAAKDGESDA